MTWDIQILLTRLCGTPERNGDRTHQNRDRMGNHGKNWSFIAGYLADWQCFGDVSLTTAITHGQALMLYLAPGAVMGDGTGSSVSDGLWPWKVTRPGKHTKNYGTSP